MIVKNLIQVNKGLDHKKIKVIYKFISYFKIDIASFKK